MNNHYINEVCFKNEKIIEKNKTYILNDKPFGVLTPNEDNPLFSVSVSNSSFSIDIWSGCSYGCKYCHVQGIYNYIKDEGRMRTFPALNTKFTIDNIVDNLLNHPFFEKNKTIISIGTGSTEPFGNSFVTKSTIEIMKCFVKRNLKNPFWIVTKAGIPIDIVDDIRYISSAGNKIMFSMCWANNPKEIEPVQNNRFKNVDLLKDISNVYVSWYMRPLVKEWGASKENLEEMFKFVYKNYNGCIDMIVPGGMRWTSGIEYALTQIHKIKMPNLIKNDNEKTLDDEIENIIIDLSKKYFPNIPLFFNSSCALSYMLKISNVCLINLFKKHNCDLSSCPLQQRLICRKNIENIDLKKVEAKLKEMGIEINIHSINKKSGKIISEPDLQSYSYPIRQMIVRTIACCNDTNKEVRL